MSNSTKSGYVRAFRRCLLSCAPKLVVAVDTAYYQSRYPDIATDEIAGHFYQKGWRQGRSPTQQFDMMGYLAGQSMAVVKRQYREHDRPFIRGAEKQKGMPLQARRFARDYVDIVDSGFLERDYYLQTYPAVVGDPVEHYIRSGWKSGYDPGPDFSTTAYLARYPDVDRAGINPLLHFVRAGRQEGRAISRPIGMPATGLHEPYCLPIEERRREIHAEIATRLIPPSKSKMSSKPLNGPCVSILVPVYDVSVIWLQQMIDSVMNQTYENWQLCMVDDCSSSSDLKSFLSSLPSVDSRIRVSFRSANGGISAASNDCLAMADGEYIALLDNDDLLTNDALEEMVKAIVANDNPEWLYSDEFKIDENNNVSSLFAKPDWSPLMLLNYMYTGHFTLYKKSVVERVGGFRSKFDFSQDYDLALRISETNATIVHVEKYLYGWRTISTSAAAGGKPTARLSNIAALQDAVDRRQWEGVAEALPTANRVVRQIVEEIRVSIVIPSDNESNISASIDSILDGTDYKNFEIIVVTNTKVIERLKVQYRADHILWKPYDKPFNFSDKCNEGAAIATGEHIVFFNDDVRVVTRTWIEALLEYLTLPGVGVVGPKLLYENGLIQHSGMATGVRRLVGTAFHCYPSQSSVHFNFAQCVREVSLICGALLAMPAKLFREIGGFDAINTPIGHSDVDLCFRAREAGYRCVYTPYATLIHIGHVSIGEEEALPKAFERDKSDVFLLKRWGRYVATDPYFTRAMRDLIYIDSPENFQVYAGSGEGEKGDVLILSHDLTTSGAPKVAFDLAVLLKRLGYFVTVASPVDGPYRSRLADEGITVLVDDLILTGHESSMVIARSFDFVIANTIVCWRSVAILAHNTPVFLYSHETELVHHFADAYPEFIDALRSASEIWCGSENAARALSRHNINSVIVEYGVDDIADADEQAEIIEFRSGSTVNVAVFGSVEVRKGQDLAVLGMQHVDQATRGAAKLRLYGRTLDLSFRHAVEKLATEMPEIEFGGELDYDQYRLTLAATDVVLVCSRDDTLPLVSLDALALGKALICSATTGTSRYLEDKRSAFILKHNSPEEIGQALTLLITNAQSRKNFGREARAIFEKYFTYGAFELRITERLAVNLACKTASATDLHCQ